MADRFVVLGVAHARSRWFADVARWATNGTLDIEFVKALSVDEVRVRLETGRRYSAVLVDGALKGVDRDLFADATRVRCPVLVVAEESQTDRWRDVGATAIVAPTLQPVDLVAALDRHADPVVALDAVADGASHLPPAHRAPLIAVLGAGGAGTSTIGTALAQGLGDVLLATGDTVLVDGRFDADHAVLHDTGDVVPGLLELVDAHRTQTLDADAVRRMTFHIEARNYRVVLGLRRRRDWTALRPRAVDATVNGLCRSFGVVVADVDADLDGEDETGSFDVEDRNAVARAICRDADVVVVVSRPGVTGIHRLVHLVVRLLTFGVPADRLVSIVNRTPNRGGARREAAKAVAELLRVHDTAVSPVFVPEMATLDRHHREVSSLPDPLVRAVCGPVARRLDAVGPRSDEQDPAPVPISPGSLGTWSEDVA